MITATFLRKRRACYPDTLLRTLFPQARTLAEVLTLAEGQWVTVPATDRVWVAIQPGVLTRPQLLEFLARVVERALSRVENPDPRIVAVVAALRVDAVTMEVVAAAEAAYAAAYAAANDAASAAEAAYAAAEAAACVAASAAACVVARVVACAAEQKQQIADILDIIRA